MKNYCPKCGGKIISYSSGVRCSDCDWKLPKPHYSALPIGNAIVPTKISDETAGKFLENLQNSLIK